MGNGEQAIVGVIAIAVGAAAALWRAPFARFIIERQNAFWGFHLGPRSVTIGSIVVVWALASAAFGMALLSGLL